ncbi:hypothetical protein [Paludisphaera rhizosphaerae]|uniref:hypothetical protein n=1 Tax=Paludisphaera rhizosphaerae TaxID=2711216 RepID=UPI0013EA12FB|nr:hypothetical protein [Paludisphaera rhizosphaerae]
MKIRSLVLTAVASAFCLCMSGCDSGGVDAISASSKTGPADAAATTPATAPKALPVHKHRSNEAPGPLPPPEV